MKFWPLGLYRVAGDSMAPALAPGDTLVGWRWFIPRAGQIVVAHHDRPIIKRIIGIQNHQIWLQGDNPAASTDSRHFGPVHQNQLEAVIIKVLK